MRELCFSAPTVCTPQLRSPLRDHVHAAATPSHPPARVTMLRVQKGRRPEDWDKKKSMLSGRFLPIDPRDEAVLDVLERRSGNAPFLDPFPGPGVEYDMGHDDERDGLPSAAPQQWSKRSAAARRRWADPAYRERVLAKRAQTRRPKIKKEKNEVQVVKKDEVQVVKKDEVDEKEIEKRAKSRTLRSEKIKAFHRNRRLWMEERLQDSPKLLTDSQYEQQMAERQERRRRDAFKRAEVRRENKERKMREQAALETNSEGEDVPS